MSAPAWVADPRITWSIQLSAELDEPPTADVLSQRLAEVNLKLGGTLIGEVRTHHDLHLLRSTLASSTVAPVVAGLCGPTLVLSAQHRYLDGLGLLAVLSALTGSEVTSTVRGLGAASGSEGSRRALIERLGEVVLTPPDRVPAVGADRGSSLDEWAQVSFDGPVYTSDLVHASVAGVGAFSEKYGGRVGRPAVAVGAVRYDGSAPRLGDHSALVRLTRLAGMTSEEVRTRLSNAGTAADATPYGRAGRLEAGVMRVALRVLAPRLGSTLLVSHLGTVTAPLARGLAFHPVTGGGSGLSIGAVTSGGTTVITARARAKRLSGPALEELLGHILAVLPRR